MTVRVLSVHRELLILQTDRRWRPRTPHTTPPSTNKTFVLLPKSVLDFSSCSYFVDDPDAETCLSFLPTFH